MLGCTTSGAASTSTLFRVTTQAIANPTANRNEANQNGTPGKGVTLALAIAAAKKPVKISGPIIPATPNKLAMEPCNCPCSDALTRRDIRACMGEPVIPHNEIKGNAARNQPVVGANPNKPNPTIPNDRPNSAVRASPNQA